MKLNDLKIGVRLGMLSALLLAAIAFVGVRGVMVLGEVYGQGAQAMETGALIEQAVDAARSAQVQFKIQVQEWKNTLLRGKDPAAFTKYRQAFIDESAATQKQLSSLEALMPRIGMDAGAVRKARQAHVELLDRYLEALKLYASDDPAAVGRVDAQVKGVDRLPTKMIDDIVTAVLEQSRKKRDAVNADSLSDFQQARVLLLLSISLSLLLGLAITWTLVRSIVRPLGEAVQIAQTVAAGDLRSQVVIRGKDETAQLLRSLKEMNDNLAGIVSEVRGGTGAITVAATQIASGNRDLSEVSGKPAAL
jgi:methyl-accepting chemotaxis protein-1 (serine sensor receptor)